MNILLVQADPDFCALLTIMLRCDGHQISAVEDDGELLVAPLAVAPDVVVASVSLSDGAWTLGPGVRALHPTPVIVLTSTETEADVLRGRELGVQAILPTPLSPRRLRAALRALAASARLDVATHTVVPISGAAVRSRCLLPPRRLH